MKIYIDESGAFTRFTWGKQPSVADRDNDGLFDRFAGWKDDSRYPEIVIDQSKPVVGIFLQ